jgi:endo-1,4-beta-xylanase
LKRLISEGAPITTVGIQGHWSVTNLNAQKFEDIERAITNYKALRLKIAISELDVTLTGAAAGNSDAVSVAKSLRLLLKLWQHRQKLTARLFTLFAKHRDAIDRVTFWGLNDRRSWRRGQSPLVFDAANQPKPGLQAIINSLAKI